MTIHLLLYVTAFQIYWIRKSDYREIENYPNIRLEWSELAVSDDHRTVVTFKTSTSKKSEDKS